MFFKLQKAHQGHTTPQDIHGVRVRNMDTQRIEAELTLAFEYDAQAGLFNLYAKRTNRGHAPRYDLLTTAKMNTVWHFAIRNEKRRRMISAELTDTKGNQEIVSLTYLHAGPVSLETLLPVAETPATTTTTTEEPSDEARKGEYTLKLWHQYGSYLKKVVAARKIQ